jgi:hypothetical protein
VLAPRGGIVATSDGTEVVVCGAMLNHYAAFDAGRSDRSSLEDATRDLVDEIVRTNPHLGLEGRIRPAAAGDRSGLSAVLSGQSAVTGEDEVVTLHTQPLADGHVLYALLVVPGSQRDTFEEAFDRMTASLTVDDAATHRR